MTSTTVHIRENITIEYHDDHRLYMIIARNTKTGAPAYFLTMSDDLILTEAEIAFDGFEIKKITNINVMIEEMNTMEGVELDT